MKVFAGIDFGKVTSCGVIVVNDEDEASLVDTLQVKLDDNERKRKGPPTPAELAKRLVRLDDFLELVLTSWKLDGVGLEIPPGVRDMKVFQQLSMYYGLAMSRISKIDVPFVAMTVGQWRKWIGVRGQVPPGIKGKRRQEIIKGTSIRAINRILGSEFELKDHDRADGVGVAIAASVAKGVYDVDDEIWYS